jgi:hypothetical protein
MALANAVAAGHGRGAAPEAILDLDAGLGLADWINMNGSFMSFDPSHCYK